MSSPSAVWLDWVPNHLAPCSAATPVAPTTICAVPVRMSAPLAIWACAASAASATSENDMM